MNRTITISILALVTAILAGIGYSLWQEGNKHPVEPVMTQPANPAAASTTTADTTLSIAERCPTITLECLQSQPEWAPTMEAEGIARIDPSELTIDVSESGWKTLVEGFSVYQKVIKTGLEYCPASYQNFFDGQREMGYIGCSEFGPNEYVEFAVASTLTGDILHAYRFSNQYSLLMSLQDYEFSTGPSRCGDVGIHIYIYPWSTSENNWLNDASRPALEHCIHPYTGVIDQTSSP